MTDRELMQQALEALNDCTYDEEGYCLNPDNVDAILALRERLAQPEQEPVAWRYDLKQGGSFAGVSTEYSRVKLSIGKNWQPLYTTPRQWQGLTDEERNQFRQWAHPEIIDAIELKLRERNP